MRHTFRRASMWLGGALVLAAAGRTAVEAQPTGPATFCDHYPDAPACAGGDAPCSTCHTTAPALNPYGEDIAANLLPTEERPLHADRFGAGLPDALVAVETLDSDGDGFVNLDEIAFGSDPADPESVPVLTRCKDADRKDAYDLCGYDADYAFKKLTIDFCGYSPTLEERQAFDGSREALHAQLDRCLDTEHWRGMFGVVWNLANSRIGPIQALKAGDREGVIPLADYDDDYAFWVYTQTDDADARDVLLGRYFVEVSVEQGRTVYTPWNRTPLDDVAERGYAAAQLVIQERRNGLLTHRWFLMANTMFTGVPRTTAAQAYRHHLGLDIGRLEGLYPIDGEPMDYDDKGVQREACAVCHTTLDPLAYPFTRYEGIGGGDGDYVPFTYNPNRMEGFVWVDGPRVADTPESGWILGEPVDDLNGWAEVAANSEPFRRKLVLDYWRLLVGSDPGVADQESFQRLVDDFAFRHGYRVEAMLHDLIDTEAYGAP